MDMKFLGSRMQEAGNGLDLPLGVAMWVGPTRLGSARIRTPQCELACPAPHTLSGLQTLAHLAYSLVRGPRAGLLFFYFFYFFYFFLLFFIFMIKLSMFKNWETLRSS